MICLTNLKTNGRTGLKAYAAAVYTRHEYEDQSVTTQLIASKTRLSPLKAISIPRLELMGALIGVRLTKQVSTALEIPMKDATFWVDSMNVLHWIHRRSRDYKPFVAHRVGETMMNRVLTNGSMFPRS